jgi:hypothetical protein
MWYQVQKQNSNEEKFTSSTESREKLKGRFFKVWSIEVLFCLFGKLATIYNKWLCREFSIQGEVDGGLGC